MPFRNGSGAAACRSRSRAPTASGTSYAESRLRELELLQRGAEVARSLRSWPLPCLTLDAEDVEDLEDAPDNEVEAAEEEILDQATAARTIAELKAEI